jgi:hypothetical protein
MLGPEKRKDGEAQEGWYKRRASLDNEGEHVSFMLSAEGIRLY